MKLRILSIALSCVALAVAGCGSGNPSSEASGAEAAERAEPKVPQATPSEAAERAKPKVPRGPTSGNLIVRDLVKGTGAFAQSGEILMVRYVAGIYETGKEIEFGGTPNRPVGFRLGSGDWSLGWEAGMPGMRVGGRRELIFPTTPDAVPPGSEVGDTLVYVVDLLAIQPPS